MIQITSNVAVHFDHDLKRYYAMGEDSRDGTFWRFTSHKEGVIAMKLNDRGVILSWPMVWNKWTIAERTRDSSPWPEAVRVACLEASNGFPCLSESADIAWEIAMSR